MPDQIKLETSVSDYSNWMQENKVTLAACRINEIFLPGTHDSGAYQVTGASTLDSPFAPLVNFAIKYVPFVHRIIARWTITQDQNIKKQLEAGVRALDLRIAYNQKTKEFYISHTFDCVPLDEVLNQIKAFMDEHKEEVIIVNIKTDAPSDNLFLRKDPNLGTKDSFLYKLYEKLTHNDYLGPLLCEKESKPELAVDANWQPKKDLCTGHHMKMDHFDSENLNIGKMIKDNKRILMCYSETSHHIGYTKEEINSQERLIWQSRDVHFQNLWMNGVDPAEWQQKFKDREQCHKTTDRKKLFDISVCLTPDLKYILRNIWRDFLPSFISPSRSLKYMAKQTVDLFRTKIREENANIKGGIISADFVGNLDQNAGSNVIKDVIAETIIIAKKMLLDKQITSSPKNPEIGNKTSQDKQDRLISTPQIPPITLSGIADELKTLDSSALPDPTSTPDPRKFTR